MIAIDTNILVYSHRPECEFHSIAAAKLKLLAEGGDLWAIPWPCVHEFINIVTHAKIFNVPSSIELALKFFDELFSGPNLRLLAETEMHWVHLKNILLPGKFSGPKVHDVRIAALCVQHGVRELWSCDRDFNRIKGLKVVNPLI